MPGESALENSRGLSGKVIMITGGCGDIGSETAARLSSFGARVILFDLLSENDGRTRARQLGAVAYKRVDQGNAEELQRAMAEVIQEFHRLDTVIGNAAVGSGGRLLDLTAPQWEDALRVNLIGCAMLAQFAVKQMLTQTPDSAEIRGKVLFTSSWVGSFPSPGAMQYCVSKAGLNHLVRLSAQEYAARGIRVNAVAPGILDAGLTRKAFVGDPTLRSKFLASVPVGEFGTAGQVADAFVFLCSRESNYMTGQIMFVDGGCSLTKKD
jgi:NAD(P)-dependent dehydrogenase (short-subunit alcohol dehydrogenase family)